MVLFSLIYHKIDHPYSEKTSLLDFLNSQNDKNYPKVLAFIQPSMFTVHSLQKLQRGKTYFLAFHEGHANFYSSITGTNS